MKFRSFLFAFFLPPIYLFVRGKVISGILSLILWLIAWGMLLSIIGAFLSPIPYLLSLAPAMFALSRQYQEAAATDLAKKMAAAMQAGAGVPQQV